MPKIQIVNNRCTGVIGILVNNVWNNNLDVQAIMNQWKTSPGHNENILASDVSINILSFLEISKICKIFEKRDPIFLIAAAYF